MTLHLMSGVHRCAGQALHSNHADDLKSILKGWSVLVQPEFPKEDTWISCQAGRGAEFQYACFGNVMQVCILPLISCH